MGIETIAAIGLASLAANQIMSSMNQSSARSDQTDAINKASGQVGAYRPEIASAMQQGVMNRSGAMQGANNVLASLYGPGGAQAPAGLTQNPMSQVFGQRVNPMGQIMNQPGAMAGQATQTAGQLPGAPPIGAALQSRNPQMPPAAPVRR